MATSQLSEPKPRIESQRALSRAWDAIQIAYDALKTAQIELADGTNWAASDTPPMTLDEACEQLREVTQWHESTPPEKVVAEASRTIQYLQSELRLARGEAA